MSTSPDDHKAVFPQWVWLIYTLLFAFSIPWYLPDTIAMHLVIGFPFWLLACVLAIFLMACFTWYIIQRYWKA